MYNFPLLPLTTPSVTFSLMGGLISTTCIESRVQFNAVTWERISRTNRVGGAAFLTERSSPDWVPSLLLPSTDDTVVGILTVDVVLFTQNRERKEELCEQRKVEERSAHDCGIIGGDPKAESDRQLT